MKKLLVLLPFVALMAACSKKETAKPSLTPKTATAADIQGKWLPSADTAFTVENGQTTANISNAAGQGYFYSYGQNNAGNIIVNGSSTPFTYSISNGVIKMIENNSEQDFTLLSIASSRMVVRINAGGLDYVDVELLKQ